MSDQLDLILRQSRPSVPAPTDEVIARARENALEIVSRSQWRRRGRIALVALAAVFAALLVSPIGIGGGLVKLLSGTPAPPQVQTSLVGMNKTRKMMIEHAAAAGRELHDRFSPVIAADARGLAAIDTPDGPIYLWAVPTEDGRQCWLIQAGANRVTQEPHGLASCDGIHENSLFVPETWWTDERPSVEIVHVRVYDGSIRRVDVSAAGAPDLSLEVVSGHVLGTIPKEARVEGLTGANADGDVVARWSRSSSYAKSEPVRQQP